MNAEWIEELPRRLASGPVALVTVAHVEGSAPRETGTTMLISIADTLGTIGGGHLEFQAIREMRERLTGTSPLELRRYALGPSLGQCCGGVVWLLFETIPATARAEWMAFASQWRAGKSLARRARPGMAMSAWEAVAQRQPLAFELRGESWTFDQDFTREPFPIHVFGAGHVGEALVRALAPLSSDIVWIDSRENAFPSDLPRGVEVRESSHPVDEVASAPAGTWFLVLTHSHDLDLALCAAVLARGDATFVGLIGSKSKRARFVHRLEARGLDCSRLTCPIGLPGITGKAPAIIAVAVAAQLAQLRESRSQTNPVDALELHR